MQTDTPTVWVTLGQQLKPHSAALGDVVKNTADRFLLKVHQQQPCRAREWKENGALVRGPLKR